MEGGIDPEDLERSSELVLLQSLPVVCVLLIVISFCNASILCNMAAAVGLALGSASQHSSIVSDITFNSYILNLKSECT